MIVVCFRTYSNAKPQASGSSVEKNSAEIETYDDNTPACSSSNKENRSTNYSQNTYVDNSSQDVPQCFPGLKKRKMKLKS